MFNFYYFLSKLYMITKKILKSNRKSSTKYLQLSI